MKDEEIIRQIKNNDIFFVHNLSLDYKFQDGTMLIHKACLYNNLDLLLYLVGKGIDVNVKGGRYDSTPLYITVYNHANELMYTLCELGADVGYVNNSKMSLFEVCIKFDNVLGFILLLHYIPNDFDIKNVHLYAHKKSKYRFLEIFKRLHAEERFTNQIVTYKSNKNHGEEQTLPRSIAKSFGSTKIFLGVFTFLFYCLPNICICFVIYTIMSNNRAYMKDKLYVYMNIFYTVYFLLKFVAVDPSASFFIIPYFILLVKLLVTVPICKKNTLAESKDEIKALLRQERYTKDYFCYICWKYKDIETIHCHMCEKCIDNYDHHCKFLGHCINGDTKTYFLIYLYSTLILLLFIANLELSKSILIHYRLITMFTIFQIVGRLFV